MQPVSWKRTVLWRRVAWPACQQRKVDFLLSGSGRDERPFEVILHPPGIL